MFQPYPPILKIVVENLENTVLILTPSAFFVSQSPNLYFIPFSISDIGDIAMT